MSDKTYTEEEVMSALELRMYRDTLCRESFDLIKAKNLEIERLKTNLSVYGQELQRKKAEAIKELAERLKADSFPAKTFTPDVEVVRSSNIDKVVKEMESETK